MLTLTVINALSDPAAAETIERYAFSCGAETVRIEEFLENPPRKDTEYGMMFVDPLKRSRVRADVVKVLSVCCAVIVVPVTAEEEAEVRRAIPEAACMSWPLSYQDFRQHFRTAVGRELEEKRTLVFGSLKINRNTRTVLLRDKELELKGYEYEIFLILAQHMGDVVSREEINRALPERKRSSGRNIDNHIKGIRQAFGEENVIRSVRSVGYCLLEEYFFGKKLEI